MRFHRLYFLKSHSFLYFVMVSPAGHAQIVFLFPSLHTIFTNDVISYGLWDIDSYLTLVWKIAK